MADLNNIIRWDTDADRVVILTFDDPNQSANTMNDAYLQSLNHTVSRLQAEKDELAGVIITSAKKTFFAGGDLNDLRNVSRAEAGSLADWVRQGKALLRSIETLGKPVVAAVNGTALGGGLEIALAAHHRIVVDDPSIQLGFPEVSLGLLPGAGGVVRSVRMLGVSAALTELLLQGPRLSPAKALQIGLVDELVPTREELLPAAKRWIVAHPESRQPWDSPGYEIPGGTPSTPALAAILPSFPANLRKQLKGANYPAPHHIMAAAVEGVQVDFQNASEIEGRYFVDLACRQVSKNMIQAFFFDMQRANGRRGRPDDREVFKPTKAVVLGAGMMGAAIAYVVANAGVEVVLKDVSLEAAERGKGYSERLVAKDLDRGRMSKERGDVLLGRIKPTADASDAAGADLVIEAVFEDPKVKTEAMAGVEPYLAPGALLGSNTSTLPITGLANNVSRPTDFIGLHFFSPVDKMPLLEIIRGDLTSDETLYRALDLARLIRKTPIVVGDSRGFFTSRVISAFINEGIAMLLEGVPAVTIEQASSQAGYPAPVLQLSDELNLKLMQKIWGEYRAAADATGGIWEPHSAERVIDEMVERGRPGRLAGAGFYEYTDDCKRLRLWPGLVDAYPPVEDASTINVKDLAERMLVIEAVETVRCRDEGVIESVADANVGSILGIGFPGWTGGVLQYINGYEGGLPAFVARAHEFASRYGDRFTPPLSLAELAESGGIYTDEPNPVGADARVG